MMRWKFSKMLNGFGFHQYRYDPFKRELSAIDGINKKDGNTLFIRNISKVRNKIAKASKVEIHGQLLW